MTVTYAPYILGGLIVGLFGGIVSENFGIDEYSPAGWAIDLLLLIVFLLFMTILEKWTARLKKSRSENDQA